jgi:hypothetical protein
MRIVAPEKFLERAESVNTEQRNDLVRFFERAKTLSWDKLQDLPEHALLQNNIHVFRVGRSLRIFAISETVNNEVTVVLMDLLVYPR